MLLDTWAFLQFYLREAWALVTNPLWAAADLVIPGTIKISKERR